MSVLSKYVTGMNSNSYAELYRINTNTAISFTPKRGLNRVNFKLFLAIVVYMGLHPREKYFSYWSKELLFSSEFIQSVPMSRNVFSSILTFIHVSDINPCNIDPTD